MGAVPHLIVIGITYGDGNTPYSASSDWSRVCRNCGKESLYLRAAASSPLSILPGASTLKCVLGAVWFYCWEQGRRRVFIFLTHVTWAVTAFAEKITCQVILANEDQWHGLSGFLTKQKWFVICVCVGGGGVMHTHACIHRKQRSVLNTFLNHIPSILFLRSYHSLKLDLSNPSNSDCLGSHPGGPRSASPISMPLCWDYRCMSLHPDF